MGEWQKAKSLYGMVRQWISQGHFEEEVATTTQNTMIDATSKYGRTVSFLGCSVSAVTYSTNWGLRSSSCPSRVRIFIIKDSNSCLRFLSGGYLKTVMLVWKVL